MTIDNFVVFIFSHGRPDNVKTIESLKRHGYTGQLYIIIDDEDKTADKYYQNFGDKVIMFSKAEAEKLFDVGDNFKDRRAVVYARNAAYGIAEKLGYKYFIQLEDDYTSFVYKMNNEFKPINDLYLYQLDSLFSSLVKFYENAKIDCLAIAQGGDFIGGTNNGMHHQIGRRRKAMNSLICGTHRKIKFVGRLNDDVNTYTESGRRGKLFMTFPFVMLHQTTTQKAKGGNSDIYLKFGTYVKSFISVMYCPSSVRVKMMRSNHARIHHSVSWDKTAPCIVSEKWRKDV